MVKADELTHHILFSILIIIDNNYNYSSNFSKRKQMTIERSKKMNDRNVSNAVLI